LRDDIGTHRADTCRLVHVYDPTDTDRIQIPLGKQTLTRNEMIWYTPCTGIWQTVFLESTPSEHISKFDLSADMNGKGVYHHDFIDLKLTVFQSPLQFIAAQTRPAASTGLLFLSPTPTLSKQQQLEPAAHLSFSRLTRQICGHLTLPSFTTSQLSSETTQFTAILASEPFPEASSMACSAHC
jgi:hypothetical protein